MAILVLRRLTKRLNAVGIVGACDEGVSARVAFGCCWQRSLRLQRRPRELRRAPPRPDPSEGPTFARPCYRHPASTVGLSGCTARWVRSMTGRVIPLLELNAVNLSADVAGGLLAYVPDYKLFGGSIAFIGFLTGGQECGQIVSVIPSRCTSGFGDPYFEADWSRSFGTVRPSHDSGRFPDP